MRCYHLSRSVARFFYAMKANSCPAVLRTIVDAGVALECVSGEEVAHARAVAGPDAELLFTPNFCGIHEYSAAFEAGAIVTIDGDDVLKQAPEVFRGRDVALRIDPGRGLGHSKKVR